MTGISLQKLTAISLVLHVVALGSSLITLRHSRPFMLPKPYTVNLVYPDPKSTVSISDTTSVKKTAAEKTMDIRDSKNRPAEAVRNARDTRDDNRQITERISAIAAKKKIERVVKARDILNMNAREQPKEASARTGVSADRTAASQNKGRSPEDYYSIVTAEIWRHWIFPPSEKKDLEAVISITIFTNGSIKIKEVEKSSGNSLFDRSVLKAITNAGPLPPPPYEMEVGIRFYL